MIEADGWEVGPCALGSPIITMRQYYPSRIGLWSGSISCSSLFDSVQSVSFSSSRWRYDL